MNNIWPAGVVLLAALAGCAAEKLPPGELARLQGGTTTVVVYGFCVPMDHLIKTSLTRHTLTFMVDGNKVGSMQSCSHATFQLKSGQWSTAFVPSNALFPHTLPDQIYRPGTTQYLYMYPAGYGQFDPKWVTKAEADAGIAEVKKIGQVF